MAAATDLVDRAIRTKQVRERVRGKAGGAFARERPDGAARSALGARNREAGKLDEWERGELLYLWSGNAASSVRSVQGAVEDRLLRAPPREGGAIEEQVVELLRKRGAGGASRDRLVEVLAAENVGATRYEARLALRRMVGAGRVEFFVGEELRKKPCTCKAFYGEVDGSSPGAPGTRRHAAPCSCGAGALEPVATAMVRLSPGAGRREIPPALTPEERWARADAELESYCQVVSCSESSKSWGSRLPAPVRGGAERARVALGRLPRAHLRVLERAYGAFHAPAYAGLSPEASRLAPLCPALERARADYVDERTSALGHWGNPEARGALDRSTYAADVLRRVLDAAPEGEAERARWDRTRAKFIEAVERESAGLLRDAVRAYRDLR